jgi:signal transduction histidine kinase
VADVVRSLPDEVVEIVHDLRAPLGVASGYLSMLKDGSFGSAPEEWSAPLEVLSLKLEEARVLVDGILALRRIDSTASIHMRDDHINLTEVARTAAKRAQPRARLLHGSVVVDSDRIGSAVAQGDQDRTLRILDNLINNALVYSGDARRVVLRVEDVGGLQVAVEDSGAGIPEERRVHLFEPFSRDDESTEVGSGLGLFISRTLAREMGGDLTLDDRPGDRGSRFVLHLRPAGTPG